MKKNLIALSILMALGGLVGITNQSYTHWDNGSGAAWAIPATIGTAALISTAAAANSNRRDYRYYERERERLEDERDALERRNAVLERKLNNGQ